MRPDSRSGEGERYWQVFQFDVKPERREDFIQGSTSHSEECVREEPGTLAFSFIQDERDENRFYALEQYADREAQQAHARGPIMRKNGPGLGPLLAGRPTLIASGDQFHP